MERNTRERERGVENSRILAQESTCRTRFSLSVPTTTSGIWHLFFLFTVSSHSSPPLSSSANENLCLLPTAAKAIQCSCFVFLHIYTPAVTFSYLSSSPPCLERINHAKLSFKPKALLQCDSFMISLSHINIIYINHLSS